MGLDIFNESGNLDLSLIISTNDSEPFSSGESPDTPQFLKGDYPSESRLVGLFQNQQSAQATIKPSYSIFLIAAIGIGIIYFLGEV